MAIYNIMFFGGLILAIIFLIASIVIFFLMRIPDAIGVVTGSTQKKAIEEIRAGGSGSGRTTGRKSSTTKGKTNIHTAIQTRDVDVQSGPIKGSGPMKGSGSIKKGSGAIPSDTFRDEKRSSDASSGIAEKAARDAKATSDRQQEAARVAAREALETEETEVLTYQDSKRDKSEDATAVLENEQATDILTAEDMYGNGDSAESETDVLSDKVNLSKGSSDASYEEETDVLKATAAPVQDASEEEETDVLRAQPIAQQFGGNSDDAAYDEEADKTDVLMADTSGFDRDAIYGTYNPDMTAVLRSDMVPNEASVEQKKKGLDQPGITVIYNETVVHTDESL